MGEPVEEFERLSWDEIDHAVRVMMHPGLPYEKSLLRAGPVRISLFRRKEDAYADLMGFGISVRKGSEVGKCWIVDEPVDLFEMLPRSFLKGKTEWAYAEAVCAILRARE